MFNESPEEVVNETNEEPSSRNEVTFDRNNSMKDMSYFEIVIIMGKSIIGVGLFAMPYTFSCVGLFFGIIFLISMGYLITISLRLLLKIHRITTIRLEKPIVMYDEIVVSILKNTNENIPTIFLDLAKYFTNIILIFYYVDIGAVCVDFICDILRTISEIEETKYPDYFTFIFFPFFMLINLSEDLHKMIFNSMVGNIFILNATAIGLAYSFQKDNSEDWKIVSKELVYYPRFFGFVFCSLSSPGLILAIEHSTQKLWNYNKLYGILDQCMTIIVGIHLIVGIVGYIKWGPNVSENFIHNIHKDRDGYTLTALVTQAAAIYFTYGLLSYVPINIVLRQYILPLIETKLRKGTPYLWDLIIRFVITLITCILPNFIPGLRLRIALIGLTCNIILTVILPLALYTILYIENLEEIDRYNKKALTLIFCITLCILFVFSSYIIDLSLFV